MKEEVNQKYCNDKYGKGNYTTWLGIRYDEPARLVGAFEYRALKDAGLSDHYISRCFADAYNGAYCDNKVIKQIALHKKSKGLNYLATLVEDEKQDILDFWSKRPFDLGIEEHLGNCVFCIKKSINKVALAARDEPELSDQFIKAVEAASDRLNRPQKKTVYASDVGELGPNGETEWTEKTTPIPKGVMFRNRNSLQSIIAKFELHSRDDIYDTIRSMNRSEPGGCTESCEAYSCQIDWVSELFEPEENTFK